MDASTAQPDSFGLNVASFENAFPGWQLTAAFNGFGFAARRVVNGRRAGPAVTAMTLDELAAKLPEAQARQAPAETRPRAGGDK